MLPLITSVFTVLILSLQFSSKKHTNPPVTQRPPRLLLARSLINSPPPVTSDWTPADVLKLPARYWSNGQVAQRHAPPSHIHNASAIDTGQKYFDIFLMKHDKTCCSLADTVNGRGGKRTKMCVCGWVRSKAEAALETSTGEESEWARPSHAASTGSITETVKLEYKNMWLWKYVKCINSSWNAQK